MINLQHISSLTMKKILLTCFTIISAFSFSNVSAQTFSTSGGDTVRVNTNGASTTEVHNNIKAPTDSVRVTWSLTDYSFAQNMTTDGICDNNYCRTGAEVLVLGSSFQSNYYKTTFNDFHVIFKDNGAAIGSTSYMIVNVTAGATTRRLVFIATKTALGINTSVKSDDNVAVFPNPARESINVLFDRQSGVKTIAIYNMIGKAMRVFKPSDDNSAKLDLDNIPSGVYFVRLLNNDGQVVATRRFTRQ